MAQIEFINVCKSFGQTKVIENLNLTIEDGRFTVLVGASGCGKTTLLRMIAGIGPATSGQILMDGKDITSVPPAKRDIAMVFQNYAIYPTMSVRENIEFGLKNRKVPKAERQSLVDEYSEIVGLTDYLDRKPSELSGGQRQRVALARAMVKKPAVFLMDEPLSNLDAKLRAAMRVELIELQRRLGTTFVYVTHDQVEAMSMADAIVLMEKGEIQQMGTPEDIYHEPNNVFTAQFIGTPPMNVLAMPGDFQVGVRPESIILSETPQPDMAIRRRGKVVTREMLGAETLYKVLLEDEKTIMVRSIEEEFQEGQPIWMMVRQKNVHFFDQDDNHVGHGGPDELLKVAGGMNDA
ncbi:ABC transporter ATP-binding protein [Eubacteriales bacterium OttesenSCG-928-A19]|nr:ABC transporter ATP-binding protein [Eubacteriales bacterium OttesenSCG-928-A19]